MTTKLLTVITALCLGSSAISEGAQLIVNGNFEAGNTGFSSAYTYGNNNPPQTYTIGNNPATAPGHYGDWASFGDHTTGSGLMMIINGGTDATAPFWSQTVNLTAGQTYSYSFWGAAIQSGSGADVQLYVSGTARGSALLLNGSAGAWQRDSGTFRATSSGSVTLRLVDLNTNVAQNDFTIDDISLTGGQHSVPESGAGYALLVMGLIPVEFLRRRLAQG
ncbi:MAG: hypothetical protein JO354_03255 [Verrucomicrobia bacterium]|nr:hypothetical protein [Verrucomicrobiota bacterium]